MDRTHHVYHLEDCRGYGTAPALAAVMASSFKKLVFLAELMINNDVVSHKGQFQVCADLKNHLTFRSCILYCRLNGAVNVGTVRIKDIVNIVEA